MVMVAVVGCVPYQTASRWCMESGKAELVCMLHRLDGSQSLGGARVFRLMKGKPVTSADP